MTILNDKKYKVSSRKKDTSSNNRAMKFAINCTNY